MLLGFKKRFVQPIQSGSKIHTFRALPKRMPKIGETLYMYTGLRTKHTELIRKDLVLKGIQTLVIKQDLGTVMTIEIDGRVFEWSDLLELPVNDGFTDWTNLADFWRDKDGNIDFEGVIFHWTDFKY